MLAGQHKQTFMLYFFSSQHEKKDYKKKKKLYKATIKTSLFPVQRVAKTVASWAAAFLFFFGTKMIQIIYGKNEKQCSQSAVIYSPGHNILTLPLNGKQPFFKAGLTPRFLFFSVGDRHSRLLQRPRTLGCRHVGLRRNSYFWKGMLIFS